MRMGMLDFLVGLKRREGRDIPIRILFGITASVLLAVAHLVAVSVIPRSACSYIR